MGDIGKYHYHEIIDRAHVANDHFYEYVEGHIAVQSNEELKVAAEVITAKMYEFYCLCSAWANNPKHATSYEEEVE